MTPGMLLLNVSSDQGEDAAAAACPLPLPHRVLTCRQKRMLLHVFLLNL